MARIRIKNFGPIRQGRLDNDGWLDIKNVSVFIGNQGSGKSCVAKLISTFMWIEKALVRSDYAIADFSAEKFRVLIAVIIVSSVTFIISRMKIRQS